MIVNTGAGGGSGGLKVIASGVYQAAHNVSLASLDLPAPAAIVFMQREANTSSMSPAYFTGFLLFPGNTASDSTETANIKVSLDATGSQITFAASGVHDGKTYPMYYLALG